MKIIAHLIVLSSIACAGLLATPVVRADDHDGQKAVLVTGASSGIGRRIAETLAANGHFVYAGARKQADIDALSAIENIRGVRLDVTRQDEVDAAVAMVEKDGRSLHGLVNNAGVAVFGPLHMTPDEELEFLFDVNVDGVVRVTRAFAPMIIANKGRIVSTGSISGILSSPTLGAYSMSKHAIEAYTDALAAELEPFGVRVSVIAPGDYASNIWASDIERAKLSEVVSADSPYAPEYRAWIDFVAAMAVKEPDEVTETVLRALSADTPARRYLVVPDEGEMAWVMGSAMRRLAELNGDHRHSYSDAELVKMLQDALTGQGAPGE